MWHLEHSRIYTDEPQGRRVTLESAWDAFTKVGLGGGALYACWLFMTRRIITRGEYDSTVKERDEYKNLCFDLLHVARKSVDDSGRRG